MESSPKITQTTVQKMSRNSDNYRTYLTNDTKWKRKQNIAHRQYTNQKPKKNKITSCLFPNKVITMLDKVPKTLQQTNEQDKTWLNSPAACSTKRTQLQNCPLRTVNSKNYQGWGWVRELVVKIIREGGVSIKNLPGKGEGDLVVKTSRSGGGGGEGSGREEGGGKKEVKSILMIQKFSPMYQCCKIQNDYSFYYQ